MATLTNRNNLIGIAALCAGSLVFSLQDSVIKAISGDHAVTLAIMLRAIVSFPIIVVMVHFAGGIRQLDTPHWPILCLRGVILLWPYTSYFMAFPALPLAEAIALYFMVPLIITVMSGPLLGERVSLKAWGAVMLGLIGVGVILRPGWGLFEPAALLSLVSAITYAYAMILARKHGGEVPATVMTFYQNAVYLLGALLIAVIAYAFGIKPPGHPSLDFPRPHLGRSTAQGRDPYGALRRYRGLRFNSADAGLSHWPGQYRDPLRIHRYDMGSDLGFAFFGEVPKWTTIIGMVLIALAGVLALNAGATIKKPHVPQD